MEIYTFKRAEENPGGRGKLKFVIESVTQRFKHRSPSEVRILDIGCGRGDFAIPLAELGFTVHGVDLSSARIEEARRVCRLPNVTFQVADALTFTWEEQFDVVLSIEIIEHLRDPKGFLARVQSMLRPFGFLIVTIPNGYSLLEVERRIFQSLKRTRAGKRLLAIKRLFLPPQPYAYLAMNEGDLHTQILTYRSLTRLLTQVGFRVLQWRSASCLYAALRPFSLVTPKSPLFFWFDKFDDRVSTWLPRLMAGGWYFSCELSSLSSTSVKYGV